MEKEIKKEWKYGAGIVLVRQSDPDKGGCGIVEMLYLPDGKGGYVIGSWGERKSDNKRIAEFGSCQDRFVNHDFDGVDVFEILKYGQKLSEIILT